jgi:ubiquinone/menaquinone biosynthesis C-methylase UbiE
MEQDHMELPPRLYNWFVRPDWFSRIYINSALTGKFDFKNKTVLDFGCGIGTSCSIFACHNYIGVDCDPRRIQYAERRYPGYTFQVLREYTIPLPENTLDYVLIIAVLHHIPGGEIPFYLNEFRRVLRPNGKVLVIEPCFFEKPCISNEYMRILDRGKYIQSEAEYLNYFRNCSYTVEVHDRKRQLCFSNKLFFTATPMN